MKFVCKVCGYVHEGDKAPEKCPVCGQTNVFTEVKDNPYAEQRQRRTFSRHLQASLRQETNIHILLLQLRRLVMSRSQPSS